MGEGNEQVVTAALAAAVHSGESQPHLQTMGERWRARILAAITRPAPGQRQHQFSIARQKRYLLPRVQRWDVDAKAVAIPALLPHDTEFTALLEPKRQATTATLPAVAADAKWLAAPLVARPSLTAAMPARPDPAVVNRATDPRPTTQPPVAPPPLRPSELASVEQSLPMRLDSRTQKILAQVLDIRIPAVKLYVNQAADTIARRYRADAVSVGDKILFRAGKFDPESPPGLGLLGHELTHSAQARLAEQQASTAIAPTVSGVEEGAALRNEAQVLRHFAPSVDGDAVRSAPPPPAPNNAGLPPAVQPRTAATDRQLGAGHPGMTAPLTEQQLKQIKDVVYQDLMARIRTEFERGG